MSADHLRELADFFGSERLPQAGCEAKERYRSARPFPHIVLDDFLPPRAAAAVARRVRDTSPPAWGQHAGQTGVKSFCDDETVLDVLLQFLVYKLNASVFLRFLEELTGIAGLIPDPHLSGGGIHRIRRGGFLKIHADYNRLERYQLDRRINVLLYLNEDWDDSWGGHLELWTEDMAACAVRVAPLLNRLVVFSTTDTSYHGHPDPLTSPEHRSRDSIALYYYTNGRPAEERSPDHSTLYRTRPDERFESRGRSLGRRLERFVRSVRKSL